MRQLLDNANIPALSLGWYQKEKGTRHAVAYGKTDTLSPSPVNTNTLFQAASLSKPVSAAIVLDLIDQDKDKPDQDKDKWTLNTPLFKYDAEFGPEELRKDPNYQIITIGMIIGQCSGLANFGENGGDGKKFIADPNSRFTYSGVALEFLMKVIEKKTGKEWEVIAQDFFKKAGMENSTFKRQLPDGHLHGIPREIAKAHVAYSHLMVPLLLYHHCQTMYQGSLLERCLQLQRTISPFYSIALKISTLTQHCWKVIYQPPQRYPPRRRESNGLWNGGL